MENEHLKLLHGIDKRLAVIEALNKKQDKTLETLTNHLTTLRIRVYGVAASISIAVSAILSRFL